MADRTDTPGTLHHAIAALARGTDDYIERCARAETDETRAALRRAGLDGPQQLTPHLLCVLLHGPEAWEEALGPARAEALLRHAEAEIVGAALNAAGVPQDGCLLARAGDGHIFALVKPGHGEGAPAWFSSPAVMHAARENVATRAEALGNTPVAGALYQQGEDARDIDPGLTFATMQDVAPRAAARGCRVHGLQAAAVSQPLALPAGDAPFDAAALTDSLRLRARAEMEALHARLLLGPAARAEGEPAPDQLFRAAADAVLLPKTPGKPRAPAPLAL